MVTAVPGAYQCAETDRMAFGGVMLLPMRRHPSVQALLAMAFIGLPWPKKIAGITVACPPSLRLTHVARKNHIAPHDEAVQLRHVVAEEFGGVGVRDLALVGDQVLLELDIGLDRVEHRRIAEGQDAPQMLLPHGRADLAGRR